MYEKRMGVIDDNKDIPLHGLFGAVIDRDIREQVDVLKRPKIKLKEVKKKRQWSLFNHGGIINLFFMIVGLSFLMLLTQTCKLNQKERNWNEFQKKIQTIQVSKSIP